MSKKKYFGVLVLLLLFLPLLQTSAEAMPYLPGAYCLHQGYEASQRECYFGGNNSCSLRGFYNGSCGQEYRENISCRKNGEQVFPEFESCCSGLKPAQPTTNWPFGGGVVLGAQRCYPQHEVFLHNNLFSIFVVSLLSIAIIVGTFAYYKFS